MMTKAGNILIVALRNMWFWAALVMLTLTSCRDNNNTPDMSPDINRVTLYPAIARSLNVEVITRANINVEETTWNASLNRYETSSEVYPDFDVNGTNISVFPVPTSNNDGVQKDENRTPGSFRYSSNKWHSSVSATDGLDYDLYAFSPANMPGATNQRFYPGAYSELLGWNTLDSEDPRRTTTFNADNVALYFTNLDFITATDPIVNVASAGRHVVKVGDAEHIVIQEAEGNDPAETTPIFTPTLSKGNYSIGKVHKPAQNANDDFYRVWLAMDHLFAKAIIYFGVDESYATLRDIRLKSAEIVAPKANRTLMGNFKYSFAERKLDFGALPTIGDGGFTEDLKVNLINDDILDKKYPNDPTKNERWDYVTLPKVLHGDEGDKEKYKEFSWFCFIPQYIIPNGETPPNLDPKFPDLELRVEYDVYSKELGNDGKPVLMRKGQKAVNKFTLSTVHREDDYDWQPRQGEQFQIKILVKPTYLYQLGDVDAMFDIQIE